MAQEPEYQSFPLVSGDTVQLEFTVRDRFDAILPLTGGSGRFAMSRKRTDSTRIVDSDASPATATIQVIDAANGRVNAVIDKTITDGLDGDYYYVMKWTDSADRSALVAHGIASFGANLI